MNAFIAFYQSSIGKKIFMSVTGLFLCAFLLEHAIGNFLLYFGKEVYDGYTEMLVQNPVIRTIEIGLFLSLLIHPLMGFILWLYNRKSRPEKYKVFRLEDNTPWSSRHTLLTGLMVLAFLVVHLYSFFLPMRYGVPKPSGFDLVALRFADPLYDLFYVVALVLLAYHLHHGFQSGFQTLGLRNKKYTPLIDTVAVLFWLIIPAVFISIPLVFYFWPPAHSGAMTAGIF